MTPQQAIQKFMAKLVDHGYSYSDSIGTAMLDAAVKSSSEFGSVQAVIDAMKADQVKAEKEAVEEVLGSAYAGKTMSEVSTSILSASAKTYDTANKGNAYYNSANDQRTTVERLIKERKAIIFLEKYCGIQLNKKFWINSSDAITSWGVTTGNVDTGAITGSDANITLKAGDVVGNVTLTAADLQTLALKDGNSLSGDTLIIGTGVEKTDRSVVPEIGNKYTATTSQAQNIKTGSNDWIVVATSSNDTIQTGGADSVNAGAGNDQITVGADYASILTGAGNDTVEISASVKNVTLGDLNSSDVLKISGTFEVGSAKIEDTLLVITDKTGTRKIRLGDFDTAKNAKINSTTIGAWLTNSGINLNNLSASSSSNELPTSDAPTEISSTSDGGEGQIAIDPDYTATPIETVPAKETLDGPTRSSSSTGTVNVNLDNVTLTSGDLEADGSKVGEISNEFPNVSSFTKNGLTINLVGTTSNTNGYPDNFTSKTYDQLTDDQKTIVAGLFKWWGKECLTLNEESYGISFNDDSTMVKEIGLYFYDGNGSSNTLATVWNWSTSGTGQNTTQLMLNINMDYYAGIKADNLDGESSKSGAGLLDRTLAHEFTHAMMATNIHYFNSLPKFIKEGMAELTHGIDDFRPTNIFQNAYDTDWLNGSLDLTNTGAGSQDIGDGYSGGYMFYRYLAKQAALQAVANDIEVAKLLVTGTENNDTLRNTLDGATINALGGNDWIENIGANVTIDGGAGNDYITDVGDIANATIKGVSVNGGDGDDTVWGVSGAIIILGGAGNDVIYNNEYNHETNITIDGGDGSDTITNYGSSAKIIGGTGSDSIYNNIASSVTIDAGDGDDTIKNTGSLAAIDAGTGDDFIINQGDSVTLSGGDDNDTIDNSGKNSYIDAGAGNDSIYNYVLNPSTISGGTGNDIIRNNVSHNTLFKYKSGDGDDIIYGFNSTSTLQIGDGVNDTFGIRIGDSDKVVVSVGAGSVVLDGLSGLPLDNLKGNLKLIFGTTANNFFVNDSLSGVTILGLLGDDTLYNECTEVTLDGGAGNDSIVNNVGGSNSSLLGGEGNDQIFNYAENVTADAGDGDDTISNNSVGVSINGGNGNDSVVNNAVGEVTINTSSGNDTIKLGASVKSFVAEGFGAGDVIELATSVDKLETVTGGIKAGNVSISGITGIATISNSWQSSASSAVYKESTIAGAKLNDDKIIYSASSGSKNLFTLSGVKNTTGVTVDTSKKIVTLTANNLDKKNITVDDDYKLALSGVSAPSQTKAAGFDGLTYKTASISEGYTAAGNKITYSAPSGGKSLFTLSGVKNTTGVTVDTTKKIVTLSADSLDKKNIAVDGDYKLALSGVSAPTQTKAAGFDGLTYKTAAISEGYTAAGNKITYSAPSGGKSLFTLSGVKNTTGVTVDTSKKIVTLTANNLDKKNVTVDGDYKLALSGVSAPTQTKAAGFDGLTYKTATISEGYTAAGNKITYSAASGGNSLFTLSGVKNTTGVTVDTSKKIVTLTANNLDKKNITVDGNYKLALSGVSAPTQTKAAGFDGTTYKTASISEGYTASGNKITYSAASGGNSLFTLSGVKNATGVTVDTSKKIVTLTANNLDKKNVTVDGDYKLALSGVSAPTQTKAAGFDGTTYKTASISEGYTASGNKITYSAASGGNSLFTLSGVKNTTGVTVDTSKKIVTLSAGNLDKKNVTVDGSYKLKLASDVDTTQEDINDWTTLQNGNIAYYAGGKGEYYSTSSNKVTYTASVAGANKFELSGAKGTPTLSGGTVKLTAGNFKSNVAVASNAGGYKVSLSGNFKGKSFTGTSGVDLVINVGKNISLIGGAGNDKITNSGKNVTISGGVGNDKITLGGGNVFCYATDDGNDTLYNFSSTDKIKLRDTSKATSTINGKDVVFTTDGGKITVKNAAQGTAVKVVNSKDKVISNYTYTADGIADGKSITLKSDFSGTFKAKNYTNVNAAKVFAGIKIRDSKVASTLTGGAKSDSIAGSDYNDKLSGNAGNDKLWGEAGNDKLYGGDGNDSISGGAGNDSIAGNAGNDKLWGDAGNDKIWGESGNDTILGGDGNDKLSGGAGKDYLKGGSGDDNLWGETGNDKIWGEKGNDTILGGDGNDKLSGGAGKDYLKGGSGNDKLWGDTGDDKLWGETGNDTLLGGDGNDKLSGGDGNDYLIGNEGNDKLWGEAGNDTLWGDTGDDSLWGGNGFDTFIYKAGEGTDKILDYTSDDMLTILKANGKAGGTFTNSKFSNGTLSLTISGGGTVIFDGVAKGDTFNINNKTYTISGKKLR